MRCPCRDQTLGRGFGYSWRARRRAGAVRVSEGARRGSFVVLFFRVAGVAGLLLKLQHSDAACQVILGVGALSGFGSFAPCDERVLGCAVEFDERGALF